MHAGFCTSLQEWGKVLMPEYWHGDLVMPQRYTKQKYKLIKSIDKPLEEVVITWHTVEKKSYCDIVWLNEQGKACERNGQLITLNYNEGRRVGPYQAIPEYALVGGRRYSVKMDKKIVIINGDNSDNNRWRGHFDSEGKLFAIDDNNNLIPDENGASFMERDSSDPGAWTKDSIFRVMYEDAKIDGSWAQTLRAWKLKYCEKTWCALWGVGMIAGTYGLIKIGRALYTKYKSQPQPVLNIH